ncbi:MAG: hypothetical protein QW780_01810 [Sulfolobales archaeon]
MSFKNALKVLEGRIERFDEVRRRSIKGVSRSKATAFDSIYEVLSKVASLIRNVSQLESSLAQSVGYTRVCGNGVMVRTKDGSAFMKFKPLRVVAYTSPSNTVRLSYGNISVEVAEDSITISLGRFSRSLHYLDPADIENNAAVYSALLSRVIAIPDALSRTVSSCAKAVGVKL